MIERVPRSLRSSLTQRRKTRSERCKRLCFSGCYLGARTRPLSYAGNTAQFSRPLKHLRGFHRVAVVTCDDVLSPTRTYTALVASAFDSTALYMQSSRARASLESPVEGTFSARKGCLAYLWRDSRVTYHTWMPHVWPAYAIVRRDACRLFILPRSVRVILIFWTKCKILRQKNIDHLRYRYRACRIN